MQTSYPHHLTPVEAEKKGQLRREYFRDETTRERRAETLRAIGEKVETPVRLTPAELLDRGRTILTQLAAEPDRKRHKALREELASLAAALGP